MYNLLIVDDEWIIREGLEKTIPWNEWGIQAVGSAKNGEEALEFLSNVPIDILLTDIRMPGVNGLELIEECKTKFSDMKIVILTGHSEFDYAKRAIKLGADDFLLKPTNVGELKNTMLEITTELTANRREEENILALVAKNALENPSKDNLTRLRSYNQLMPNYGILVVQSNEIVNRKNSILIDRQEKEAVHLYHGLENEIHWEQRMNDLIEYILENQMEATISASLLGYDLEQLPQMYKQAKSASTLFYQEKKVTWLRYNDEKYNLEIEKAILHINNHYTQALSQVELANTLHMSNSYFSRLFKQHTGMNFVDYLTAKRLEEAKKLLGTTKLKIHEIAKEVGYPESRYFSQLFKKNMGCTPREYRNGTWTQGKGYCPF